MSKLGAYVQQSTANPQGWRPYNFALQSPLSKNPSASGGPALSAYYPADYYVPTPLNVLMQPQQNILGYLGQDLPDWFPYVAGAAVLAVLYFILKGDKGRSLRF
jgi:hypothetical protein